MKIWCSALLLAMLAFWPGNVARAQTVLFDFDSGTPTLFPGLNVPFDQTAGGMTAHFSSPQGAAFSVQSDASTAFHLSQFSGHYLYDNNLNMNYLDIKFSKLLNSITLTFATADFHQTETPTTIQLTAYRDSTGTLPVGSISTHATYGTDTMPMGTLSFTSSTPFNLVEIVLPPQTLGVTDFLVDNIAVTVVPVKVGTFRPTAGTFYLDYNGNGAWDGCGTDECLSIGMNGDIPVVGDWNGSGTSKVGTFRPSAGTFYLDYNGNGHWDGCSIDHCLSIGMNGDVPLVGDWNGSGTSKVGTFRPSAGTFYLDYNGNGVWDGCGTDSCLSMGMNGDIPLVGDWNGSGTAKVGTFRPSAGTFYLDYNGDGLWNGCGIDRCLGMGMNGDTPLVGKW